MFYDCLTDNDKPGALKIFWLLVIVLLHPWGYLLYGVFAFPNPFVKSFCLLIILAVPITMGYSQKFLEEHTGKKMNMSRSFLPHSVKYLDYYFKVGRVRDPAEKKAAKQHYVETVLRDTFPGAGKRGMKVVPVRIHGNRAKAVIVEIPDADPSLMAAVLKGDFPGVQESLEKGGDVNVRSASGYTALMEGVQYGYEDIVNLLVQKGADVSVKAPDGETALSLALKNDRPNLVKILKGRE